MSLLRGAGSGVVLDFDFESKPLWFWYEKPTAIITSVSYMYVYNGIVDHDSITTQIPSMKTREDYMDWLYEFTDTLKGADVLTGHNIDRFDLPLFQAQLIRFGLPGLPKLMTQDTMRLPKKRDISVSQESLLNYDQIKPECPLGFPVYKDHLSIPQWEDAALGWNDEILIERPMSDVHGHVHLREVLLDKGYLAKPRAWYPTRK